ncbi:hypothetical protein E4U31_000125 [Claviceps sp. LM219 group G6]|nr:hypothetical protein E4U31_000125 [Claviceps sp. LM219 group G6]
MDAMLPSRLRKAPACLTLATYPASTQITMHQSQVTRAVESDNSLLYTIFSATMHGPRPPTSVMIWLYNLL